MQKTTILQQLCKNSNNFFDQNKEKKKKHLQANGFQRLKKTFTNNEV